MHACSSQASLDLGEGSMTWAPYKCFAYVFYASISCYWTPSNSNRSIVPLKPYAPWNLANSKSSNDLTNPHLQDSDVFFPHSLRHSRFCNSKRQVFKAIQDHSGLKPLSAVRPLARGQVSILCRLCPLDILGDHRSPSSVTLICCKLLA